MRVKLSRMFIASDKLRNTHQKVVNPIPQIQDGNCKTIILETDFNQLENI